MRHTTLPFVLLASLLLTACSTGASAPPTPISAAVRPNAPFLLKGVSDLKQVARLIGADSINKTDRYAVAGADLGSMINLGDKTYFIFGDTFGKRDANMTGGGGTDWRSNVMAVSSDIEPSDGITFDRFIADGSNHANELITSAKVDNQEITRVPTHGVAVGSNMYLYFMSVNHWGAAGVWYANYSGVGKSTDGGEHWQVIPGLQWPGDGNFIQVSPFKIKNTDGSVDIYFWAIPAGRFGPAKLMKVAETQIEQLSSYRYYAGSRADGTPIWSPDMNKAAVVVNDTVGELSVIWDSYLDHWIMTYLRGGGNVVIREGINPWGPWGEPIDLVTQAGFPGLYAPFMNPKFVEDDGHTIYFCLSQWGPYAVYWMKATLTKN
ncbi:MAG: DUF4185 domain-containing protein [Chloroflexia bacterium]